MKIILITIFLSFYKSNFFGSMYTTTHLCHSRPSSMSTTGIQGHLLEVTVIGCAKLKDKKWIGKQSPYVCLEYGNNKFQTTTCNNGGKNPNFQEKCTFTLIEGLREMKIMVWNSKTFTSNNFIGSGKVELAKVLSQGFDDTAWQLQSNSGRYAGEVLLILHYKPPISTAPPQPQQPPPATGFYPTVESAPSFYTSHPLSPVPYPLFSYAHPSQLAAYPPLPYPPPASPYHPSAPYHGTHLR